MRGGGNSAIDGDNALRRLSCPLWTTMTRSGVRGRARDRTGVFVEDLDLLTRPAPCPYAADNHDTISMPTTLLLKMRCGTPLKETYPSWRRISRRSFCSCPH